MSFNCSWPSRLATLTSGIICHCHPSHLRSPPNSPGIDEIKRTVLSFYVSPPQFFPFYLPWFSLGRACQLILPHYSYPLCSFRHYTSKVSRCYAIMADIGLNLMILLSNIQATEARAHNVTPPQPKSMLHEVVKRRAVRRFRGTGPPITPSSGPSIILVLRSCALLKWIIVRVNRAKVAGKKIRYDVMVIFGTRPGIVIYVSRGIKVFSGNVAVIMSR